MADASSVLVEKAGSLPGWAEVIRHRFIALQIAPHRDRDPGGVVRTRHVGHLQASVVSSVPQTFTRTKQQASRGEFQLFALGFVESGAGYLVQDGRTCTVSAGSFALYETSRPFDWTMTGDWRLRVYTWPREAVALSESGGVAITASAVCRDSGIGQFLAPMLDRLAHRDCGLSVEGAAGVAAELAELCIIAAGEVRRAGPANLEDSDRLREILAFIEDNLADPTLSPGTIAKAFFISTSTLHRLFAQRDTTVAAWIKHRRLETCRHALGATGSYPLTINQIAARAGFSNQAFFSREFSAAYGMSPRDYRLHHGR